MLNTYTAGTQSDVVLLDLDLEGLRKTKAMIVPSTTGVNVHLIEADLGELDSLESTFAEIAKIGDSSSHDQYVLIHNAGTIGDVSKSIAELHDPKPLQDYLAVNFTAVFVLTSHFLSRFTEGHRVVVNMTSSLATRYHPGCSYYTPGKAARNALMGVLAVENPSIRVLNYHPGSVDTDMLRNLRNGPQDNELTQSIIRRYAENTVLTCEEAVSKLIKILKDDSFKSGAYVDYYSYS